MKPDGIKNAAFPTDAVGAYVTAEWTAENGDVSEERAETILEDMVSNGALVRDPEPGKYRPAGLVALMKAHAKYTAKHRMERLSGRLRGGADDETETDE